MRRSLGKLLKIQLKALAPISVIVWILSSLVIVFGGAGFLDHQLGVSQMGVARYLLASIVLVVASGLAGLIQLGKVLERGEAAVDASVRQREHEKSREAEALAGGLPGQLSVVPPAGERGDLSIAEKPGAVSLARRDPPKTH